MGIRSGGNSLPEIFDQFPEVLGFMIYYGVYLLDVFWVDGAVFLVSNRTRRSKIVGMIVINPGLIEIVKDGLSVLSIPQ